MLPSLPLRGFLCGLLLSALSIAAPTCNTPSNRACWNSKFSIDTDYETSVPLTGVTRKYTLVLTEVDNWVGPDGRIKTKAMLINGTFPGPTITADWGDTFSVTVINNLQVNGTSMHWHGIRQLNNSIHDGANGITECPIPPGHQKTYTFLAEQYGTSWYHSHFGVQYGNGVIGTMIINGPASLPYDTDLGVFPIGDWYLAAADTVISQLDIPASRGAPPKADNILINGTNINPAGTGGSYAKVGLTPGKRHRLRLINTSVETAFTVSLVDHDFTVIATDFVPVNSFTTSSLFIGIGQRYDVTIDASKSVDNYWFNVTMSNTGGCGGTSNPYPAAIFTYTGAADSLPTKVGTPPPDSLCDDSVTFTPIVTRSAPGLTYNPSTQDLPVQLIANESIASTVQWRINGSAIYAAWDRPTLQYVLEGNTSYPKSANVIQVPESNIWSFWVIENLSPVPHPMHLHGHDLLKLGSSPPLANPFAVDNTARSFSASTDLAGLRTSNPVRRDVTMLPALGWLAVAFKTDNPGAWLFHCHIAWHVSQGLSVQYLERVSSIGSVQNLNTITQQCNDWRSYYATSPYKETGSGL